MIVTQIILVMQTIKISGRLPFTRNSFDGTFVRLTICVQYINIMRRIPEKCLPKFYDFLGRLDGGGGGLTPT